MLYSAGRASGSGGAVADGGGDLDGHRGVGAGLALDCGCAVGDQAEPVGGRRPQHAHVRPGQRVGSCAAADHRGDGAVVGHGNSHMNDPRPFIGPDGEHIRSRAVLSGNPRKFARLDSKAHAPTVPETATTAQAPVRCGSTDLSTAASPPPPSLDQGVALRQSSVSKARNDGTVADDTTVMQEIHSLRELLTAFGRGDLSDRPLDMVQHNVEGLTWHPDWQEAFDNALARARLALFKDPVKLLQALPGEPDPFLYHWDGSGLTMLDGVVESGRREVLDLLRQCSTLPVQAASERFSRFFC